MSVWRKENNKKKLLHKNYSIDNVSYEYGWFRAYSLSR